MGILKIMRRYRTQCLFILFVYACCVRFQIATEISKVTIPHHLPGEKYCLSSSLIDLHTNGYHFYPLDLFSNNATSSKGITPHDPFTLFNCTSQRNQPYAKHICSSVLNPCPVFYKNILDATARSDAWVKQQPYLHRIWQTMLDSTEIVRVIVLGGSGALGGEREV